MQQTAAPCILIMYLKHSIIRQNAQHLHHQLRLSATTPVMATYASSSKCSSMVIIFLNSVLSCSNNSNNSYTSNSKISINCNNCAATTAPAMAAYATSDGISNVSTTVSKISVKSCSNIRISSISINCNYCAATTAPAMSSHAISNSSTISTTIPKKTCQELLQLQQQHELQLLCCFYSSSNGCVRKQQLQHFQYYPFKKYL